MDERKKCEGKNCERENCEGKDCGRKSSSGKNYTYIVKCSDGTLYTGWTNHLEERIRAHNSGHGAKYTRSRRPVELVYYETFDTKEEAMSREFGIKKMDRQQKEKLIKDWIK